MKLLLNSECLKISGGDLIKGTSAFHEDEEDFINTVENHASDSLNGTE